jgi:murein DD-endopeptidase MepM/ murein hydrolase activator NlpD
VLYAGHIKLKRGLLTAEPGNKIKMKIKTGIRRRIKRILIFLLFLLAVLTGLYWYSVSRVTHHLDSYVYELPYAKGTSHKVIQGYGGLFSHNSTAALDFYMPVGTPVYAAREGDVFSYKDNGQKSGPFKKYKNDANYIMIRHPDGSFGCYWHLQYKGVVTKKGKVEKGQLIGYSGDTGFVLGPHLHFSVKRMLNYSRHAYLRTKFRTAAGVQLLKRGSTCKRPL